MPLLTAEVNHDSEIAQGEGGGEARDHHAEDEAFWVLEGQLTWASAMLKMALSATHPV